MKSYTSYSVKGCFRTFLIGASIVGLAAVPVAAQTFSSGSDESDGPFNPTCTPTPCTVTVPLPADGVFNFTTADIPDGVTVKFARNAANTPVFLLATGDVTINGTIDMNGEDAGPFGRPGRGGPGGFDGGVGADGITTVAGGFGLGPGGGGPGIGRRADGGGGGYLVAGENGSRGLGEAGSGGPAYGSPVLRPIVGGSGGGGGGAVLNRSAGGGGGGGGGAIVVVSSGTVTLGTKFITVIHASGGDGKSGVGGFETSTGGSGSGGAILVIATTIRGTGVLSAGGRFGGGRGADGRIRLETINLDYTRETNPIATTGLPQPVFAATGQPILRISSVQGVAGPASPSGNLLGAPDILLPAGTTNPVEVVVTASNIPLGTTIQVTATPQSGELTTATSTGLSGSLENSTATANITLDLSRTSVLTATATFPLLASLGGGPVFAEGQEVKWVKVAANYGGDSKVTYIAASGKEVRIR